MITPVEPDLVAMARLHRVARIGLAVLGLVIVVPLLAFMYFPTLSIPSTRLVGWHLTGFAGPQFDPEAARTRGEVRVFIAGWPVEYRSEDASWLAPPDIIYTPWSVTITLHTTDAYANPPGGVHGWYDTGGWVDVHLGLPLGGRVLFDGSTLPPEPRLY